MDSCMHTLHAFDLCRYWQTLIWENSWEISGFLNGTTTFDDVFWFDACHILDPIQTTSLHCDVISLQLLLSNWMEWVFFYHLFFLHFQTNKVLEKSCNSVHKLLSRIIYYTNSPRYSLISRFSKYLSPRYFWIIISFSLHFSRMNLILGDIQSPLRSEECLLFTSVSFGFVPLFPISRSQILHTLLF